MSGPTTPAQEILSARNVSYNAVSRSGSGSSEEAPNICAITTRNVSYNAVSRSCDSFPQTASPSTITNPNISYNAVSDVVDTSSSNTVTHTDPNVSYNAVSKIGVSLPAILKKVRSDAPQGAIPSTQNVSYKAAPKVAANASYGVSSPAAADTPHHVYERGDHYYSTAEAKAVSIQSSLVVPVIPPKPPKNKPPTKKLKMPGIRAFLIAFILVACGVISFVALGISVASIIESKNRPLDPDVTLLIDMLDTELSNFMANVTQAISILQADLASLDQRLTQLESSCNFVVGCN